MNYEGSFTQLSYKSEAITDMSIYKAVTNVLGVIAWGLNMQKNMSILFAHQDLSFCE